MKIYQKKMEEVIVGYCCLCRSYEVEHYSEVVSELNDKHFKACKDSKCKHPVFYLVDHDERKTLSFPVEVIETIFTENPEASFDDFK